MAVPLTEGLRLKQELADPLRDSRDNREARAGVREKRPPRRTGIGAESNGVRDIVAVGRVSSGRRTAHPPEPGPAERMASREQGAGGGSAPVRIGGKVIGSLASTPRTAPEAECIRADGRRFAGDDLLRTATPNSTLHLGYLERPPEFGCRPQHLCGDGRFGVETGGPS